MKTESAEKTALDLVHLQLPPWWQLYAAFLHKERAVGQTPGLLSASQSLAFHSVEFYFNFPSKLMLPEQHSLLFHHSTIPLTVVVPASEGGPGAEKLDLVPALKGKLSCSVQEKPFFFF